MCALARVYIRMCVHACGCAVSGAGVGEGGCTRVSVCV